jgi:hypothetical protein
MSTLNVENIEKAIIFFKDLHARQTRVDGTSIPAIKFNDKYFVWHMQSWVAPLNSLRLREFLRQTDEVHLTNDAFWWLKEHHCGTAACALGWIGLTKLIKDHEYTQEIGFTIRNEGVRPTQFIRSIFGSLTSVEIKSLFYSMLNTPLKIAEILIKILEEEHNGTRTGIPKYSDRNNEYIEECFEECSEEP